MVHLCCSEVSISPLFRWPNSVNHYSSTVTAGENSEIRFTWWLGNELETTIARIGQNGLLPNTPYQLIEGRITAVS
ncbi:hypothetical protein E4R31_21905 [Salmonella enterica]|nr:hypothetical protein [Salmonella enterica]ECA7252914.1 hypothetical protein [Salmonella enterica subsp. enterica serovar Oranienburg]